MYLPFCENKRGKYVYVVGFINTFKDIVGVLCRPQMADDNMLHANELGQ